MSSNSNDSVTICGLAVLENPRVYEMGKLSSIAFDAQFYLAPGISLVAHLRYFNENGLDFDDMGCYMVCAGIAKTQCGAKLGSEEISQEDYHVVGDIYWLIPVSVSKEQLRRNRPWITIAATADQVNDADSTFHMEAAQYTHANRATGHPSTISIDASFSSKFSSKKPVPKPNSHVTVEGYLSRFTETDGIPDCFHVEVERITFQGRAYVPKTPVRPTVDISGIKRKQGLKFSFDDDDEGPLTSSPSLPSKKVRTDTGLLNSLTPVRIAST